MNDLLPPKRQPVVERLVRRMDYYRRHNDAVIPRHDQAESGTYDQTRQDTLMLKQRFLENKSKKVSKKNENRNSNKATVAASVQPTSQNGISDPSLADTQRNILEQQKLYKRTCADAFGGSPLESNTNHCEQGEDPERLNTSKRLKDQRSTPDQGNLQQSISVQIVQQFSSSSNTKAPHSQTIQTNVTVQTLPGGQIKASGSPLPTPGVSTTPTASDQASSQGFKECKQEKVDSDFQSQCSVPREGCGNPGASEHFTDSFSNIGLITDDSDDLNPQLLQDIMYDVFTNTSNADLMNEFNFDSVKDADEVTRDSTTPTSNKDSVSINTSNNCGKNSSSGATNNGANSRIEKTNSPATHQSIPSTPQYSSSPSLGPAMFDLQQQQQTSISQIPPSPASRIPPLDGTLIQSPGGSIDFKEPTFAAQTLKQMAEQHQQQKQHIIGSATNMNTSPHQRPSFQKDNPFQDSMSPLPTSREFFNSSQSSTTNFNSIQQQSKPSSMFSPVYTQCSGQTVPSTVYTNNSTSDPNVSSPSTLNESDVQNRKVLQIQQQLQKIAEQKSPPPGYGATKPLSHYSHLQSSPSQAGVNIPQQQQQQPQPHMQGQFMRRGPSPSGMPQFVERTSPTSSAAPNIQMSQTQHFTQNAAQQIQATQCQQIHVQEIKSQQQQQTMFNFQQQQQHVVRRNNDRIQQQMAQNQSVSYSTYGIVDQNPISSNTLQPNVHQAAPYIKMESVGRGTAKERKSMSRVKMNQMQRHFQQQQQQQQMMQSRPPPPEYKTQQPVPRPAQSSIIPTGANTNMMQGNVPFTNVSQMQQQMQQRPGFRPQMVKSGVVNGGQRMMNQVQQPNLNGGMGPMAVVSNDVNANGDNVPIAGSAIMKPNYPTAMIRNQRPPNANVGPDGLNITQKASTAANQEWRQMLIQQQQAQNHPRFQSMSPQNRTSYVGTQPSYPHIPTIRTSNDTISVQQHQHIRLNPAPANAAVLANQQQAAYHPPRMNIQQRLPQPNIENASHSSIMGVEMSASMSQTASLGINMAEMNSPNQTQRNLMFQPQSNVTNTAAPPTNNQQHPQPTTSNNDAFNLEFLDNIDGNASGDIINLEQVMEMIT